MLAVVAIAGCGDDPIPPQQCPPPVFEGSWRNEATGDVLSFVGGNPTIAHAAGGKTALVGKPYYDQVPVSCGIRGPRRLESLERVQDGFRLRILAAEGAEFEGVATSAAEAVVRPEVLATFGPPTPLLSRVEVSGEVLTATVVIGRETLSVPDADLTWSLRWQMQTGQGQMINDGLDVTARFACTGVCVLNFDPLTDMCLR